MRPHAVIPAQTAPVTRFEPRPPRTALYVPRDPCRVDLTNPHSPATTVDDYVADLAAQDSGDASQPDTARSICGATAVRWPPLSSRACLRLPTANFGISTRGQASLFGFRGLGDLARGHLIAQGPQCRGIPSQVGSHFATFRCQPAADLFGLLGCLVR